MKLKFFVGVLILLAVQNFHFAGSNVALCLGVDATICSGQTVTITNCNTGGSPGNASGLYLSAPSSVSLSDDVWSQAVTIGFPFNFYNQSYTQCVIGSNGLISFNTNQSGQYCPWSLIGGPLPNGTLTGARNSAMITYQDINPSLGGQIQYQTIGTAPNRKFVVLYKDIYMFSCTSQCNYMAIVLYETTNVIEYHIGNKPICNTWNSGLAIQGTENNAMTVAHTTTGRNNTVWGANQDGRRYTPTTATNTGAYIITQIPYLMVNSPGSNFVWNACNSSGTILATFPYNNGVLNLPSSNPNYVIPPGTSGYFLSGSACGTAIGSITNDTTWITVSNPTLSATSIPDICSQGLGSVTAVPGANSPPPYTFNWPALASTLQTVNNVIAGTYTVSMIDGNGCSANASVTVGDTPASFTGSTTQVSCANGNNGTATALMTPALGNLTYQWNDPQNQTTQTATGLVAGTYTCIVTSSIGCSGSLTVNVTEIPTLTLTVASQTDVTCNSASDGTATISVSQGTAPYTYDWDISSSTSNIAIDLNANTHTLTVTDNLGCVNSIAVIINEPDPLSIVFTTPDSMICSEAVISLVAQGIGGSSPYMYTWSENGQQIGVGSTISADPQTTNTQYCVVLSEQCGSPTTQECLTITFPTPISPNVIPDKPKDCVPGEFIFTNTSTNPTEIFTTQFNFSNGESFLVNGSETLQNDFPSIGNYSLEITITSVYGCIYENTINDIVEVTPLPTADFTVSKNPATWFETTIQTSDLSLGNISQWSWSSPGSSSLISGGGSAIISYPEGVTGIYPITLSVTTAEGCSDSITLEIEIVPDIILYAPNSFTPDDDEHNQNWFLVIDGIDFENYRLEIYNRWGHVIWESFDAYAKWDGRYNGILVPDGTYTWKLSYKLKDNDSRDFKTGFINVLR